MTCGCFWKIAATFTTGISSAAALKACRRSPPMWNWMRSASRSARLLTCGPPEMIVDVEAAFGVGAIGDRLVEAAMFGLGQPVGAEGDLCQVVGGGAASCERGGKREERTCEAFP
jgi:hypothetical protein